MSERPRLDPGIRVMLGLSGALTRVGILPGPRKVARMPAAKRKAVKPARWLVGPLPAGVTTTDLTIPSRGGPLPLRVYQRSEARADQPIVFWLHGGGFLSGGRASADHLCHHLALELDATVVAVEYRLAPEFAFPAALEDCHDALEWMIEHADEFEADAARIAVMGESAGGNLTAALCLVLREAGGPEIALQGLVYPGLDLRPRGQSTTIAGLAPDLITQVRDAYVGDADPTNPLISPLLEPDLSRLPPALVITADVDPFRADGERFATHLEHAGVPVRYTNYLKAAHGFLDVPRLARCWPQAMSEIVREARRRLAPAE